MPQLYKLALQFQHALDGTCGSLSSTAADDAGASLMTALMPGLSDGSDEDHSFLEPIILRSKLAASIVAYWERIPWGALTLQTLSAAAVRTLGFCRELFPLLFYCAMGAAAASNGRSPVGALLLRQVWTPSIQLQQTKHSGTNDASIAHAML